MLDNIFKVTRQTGNNEKILASRERLIFLRVIPSLCIALHNVCELNAEPEALKMWLFHVAVFEVFEEYIPLKYILHAQIKSRFQMAGQDGKASRYLCSKKF